MHHPKVNISHWCRQFPLAEFEKPEGPRQFDSTPSGDPLDLWKARGRIISSPVDLAITEQVRRRAAKLKDLGTTIPVDIFLWAVGAPKQPYLTKIGGVPHRSKDKPWPQLQDGTPMTFVAQICFLDSTDILPKRLPGDLLLVFVRHAVGQYFVPSDVHFEWSFRDLAEPLLSKDCPAVPVQVPELSGVIHRTREYPEYPAAWDAFETLGHYQHYLFARTQSTKIGQETWFIQHDPRRAGEKLFCTFNSLQPNEKWPFTNLESLTATQMLTGVRGRDQYEIMFGDVGCMYFIIDRRGKLRCESDCY